jgi:hypothetical protein
LREFYTRVVPSHAIELTAVFLDRNVTAILAHWPNMNATPEQKQELATIIHPCGAGSAKAFVRRGFSLIAGERCGDHDVATYLAQVNAMKREFLRFAGDRQIARRSVTLGPVAVRGVGLSGLLLGIDRTAHLVRNGAICPGAASTESSCGPRASL